MKIYFPTSIETTSFEGTDSNQVNINKYPDLKEKLGIIEKVELTLEETERNYSTLTTELKSIDEALYNIFQLLENIWTNFKNKKEDSHYTAYYNFKKLDGINEFWKSNSISSIGLSLLFKYYTEHPSYKNKIKKYFEHICLTGKLNPIKEQGFIEGVISIFSKFRALIHSDIVKNLNINDKICFIYIPSEKDYTEEELKRIGEEENPQLDYIIDKANADSTKPKLYIKKVNSFEEVLNFLFNNEIENNKASTSTDNQNELIDRIINSKSLEEAQIFALSQKINNYDIKGKWKEAIEHIETAIDIAENSNEVEKSLELKMLMGKIYGQKGEYDKSLKILSEVVSKVKNISNNKEILGKCYINIGEIYRYIGGEEGLENSINNFDEALKIGCELDNQFIIGMAKDYKGVAYRHKGLYDTAIQIHTEAKDIKENIAWDNPKDKLYFISYSL
ncbi:MAG: tetratricopeptide repeat protein, partial [bacterium]